MLPENIDCFVINTGNLINSKELKKKAIQTPTEEVFDSACTTFHSTINSPQSHQVNDSNLASCTSPQSIKVNKEDRIQLKVSVKVFLSCYSCDDLKSSIHEVMKQLDIHLIDSFILALPSRSESEKFDIDQVKPLWSELENFISDGKIVTIGISDLDTSELIELHKSTQVKPSVNQVNLESCCVMPPDMIAFAKDNDIQLLTHNDPKVLLPEKMVSSLLSPAVASLDRWRMRWIARYSVIIKCRGIIQNKGYLLCAARDP